MGDKVREVIEKMTLEEKAALVNGASFFGTAEIPAHGIRRMQLLDGGTGINYEQLFGDICSLEEEAENANGMTADRALKNVTRFFYEPEMLNLQERYLYNKLKELLEERTGHPDYEPGCFPPGILLGATFEPEVVRSVGEALGLEAELYKVDILLGTPNVNILRDPLSGRFFEGYSEDPCVVSVMAPELVKGVQTHSVAANVKHFAANNQETNRIGINEIISKRALEEIYLPGFKACVQEGEVGTVMSAYNRINGTACTENSWLLKDVLRKEWEFDGFVMSDWGAVYHPAEAVAAGNDLAMPGPGNAADIVDAVREGRLSEQALDDAVSHILGFMDWLNEKKENAKPITASSEELARITDKAAYDAAAEGIVLLKNENDIFPIRPEDGRHVTLIGTGYENFLICGSGSAGVVTNRAVMLEDELKRILGELKVSAIEVNEPEDMEFDDDDTILVIASVPGMEGNDRPDMELDPDDRWMLNRLVAAKRQGSRFKVGLLLNTGGPVSISEYEPYLDGIFWMFLPGMQGGRAMADILTGDISPSGKLPVTYPRRYEDTPSCLNFPGDGWEVNYGEGIYVGYRYYDKKKIEPLYAFGYGLSYARFAIANVSVDREVFTDRVRVSGRVRNTGDVSGSQTVQLYVGDIVSSHSRPVKELKRFRKIFLQPGEETEFYFVLTVEDFKYYDADYGLFLAEEGYFDLIVATSSRAEDEIARKKVYLKCEGPYSYGLNSTIKVFYENDALRERLLNWWKREGLDRVILESNYQYTSCRKLREIIPEDIDCNPESSESFRKFMEEIGEVVKP